MCELQFLYYLDPWGAGRYIRWFSDAREFWNLPEVINSILNMMGNIKLVVTIFSFLFILHPKWVIPWLVSIVFHGKTESLKLKSFDFNKMVPKKLNHVNFSKSITEAAPFQACMKWKDFLALQMQVRLSHFLKCTDVVISTLYANLTLVLLSPFYWHWVRCISGKSGRKFLHPFSVNYILKFQNALAM